MAPNHAKIIDSIFFSFYFVDTQFTFPLVYTQKPHLIHNSSYVLHPTDAHTHLIGHQMQLQGQNRNLAAPGPSEILPVPEPLS